MNRTLSGFDLGGMSSLPQGVLTAAYLAAAILFILSIGGLSSPETARRGNMLGIIGMGIAIVATALSPGVNGWALMMTAIALGSVVGIVAATRVGMTSMPELVGLLNSFGGLAAVLVAVSSELNPPAFESSAAALIHDVEIYLAVFVGALTFTGSVIAFLKLRGTISSKPVIIPGRHVLNLALIAVCIGLSVRGIQTHGFTELLIVVGISSVLGIHLVLAIGGADMPVVVSVLNAYSGFSAAAAGFMLENDLLIVTGAIVGSSGAILSHIMCKAMNRSIWNVIFGGFGQQAGAKPVPKEGQADLTVTEFSVDDTVAALESAKEVVIVPGYGMAVAQAQSPIWSVTRRLKDRGINVRFAIHPVAGRLPGHMNVLLAEANVPYDIVLEMDEINEDLKTTDVVMVIGANDIVNPDAMDDPQSPIAGMPVLEVWNAETVVVMKRGLAAGYAGVANPLFFKENTRMLFGDARKNVEAILGAMSS